MGMYRAEKKNEDVSEGDKDVENKHTLPLLYSIFQIQIDSSLFCPFSPHEYLDYFFPL